MLAVMVMASTTVAAAEAQAACSATQQRELAAAARTVAALRAARQPSTADAASILVRARTQCRTAGYALAMGRASLAWRAPAEGRRGTTSGFDLVAVRVGRRPAWRLDLPAMARRVRATSTSPTHRVWLERIDLARRGTSAVSWSVDPTAHHWRRDDQLAVAATLATSRSAHDRDLAARTVIGMAARARATTITRAPLVDALQAAGTLSAASSRSRSSAARAAAERVASPVLSRLRASEARSWSRINGRWTTVYEHRALVVRGTRLAAHSGGSATRSSLARMSRSLRTAPSVSFEQIPHGAFYPLPHDGAWDVQRVGLAIDKPAQLQVTVYDVATHAPIRVLTRTVVPGPVAIAWDGRDTAGRLRATGSYRYAVDAVDRAGNRTPALPGPGTFTIGRDRTAPHVRAAAVRYVASAPATRLLVTSWRVGETLSPRVTTVLTVRGPGAPRNVTLSRSAQSGTVNVRLPLRAGTWRVALVFVDGSGNRTGRYLGGVTLR